MKSTNPKDYILLVPNMLPIHFRVISKILAPYGYDLRVLDTNDPKIISKALSHIHNDICYPAQVVIGQMLYALENTDLPREKIALALTQTGGGCRASNYIYLLKRALAQSGYDDIPVFSVAMEDSEHFASLKLTPLILLKCVYSIYCSDLMMLLAHQSKPYERDEGSTDLLIENFITRISTFFSTWKAFSWHQVVKLQKEIIKGFEQLSLIQTPKPKVGVVGEIYVKYSPIGNNNLESFLLEEGCEIVSPGLLDFVLYCLSTHIYAAKHYKLFPLKGALCKGALNILCHGKETVSKFIRKYSHFTPPGNFKQTMALAREHINLGVAMGEGWLLTGEMLELLHQGVSNIICTQPFGCLPNHIVGKGMVRSIKSKYPQANIVNVDYDSSASSVNQQNRIKLMLANAK